MSEKSRLITRRSFLTLCAAGTAAVLGGFVYVKRSAIQLLADKLRYNTSPYRLDPAAGTGALADAEMGNILSLAVVLIPWRQGEATVWEMTCEFVDAQCRFNPGARQAYQGTSALLDVAAFVAADGACFSDLDRELQETIVAGIMPPPIRSRRDWRHVYNMAFRYEETRTAELVVNNLLINFYNDDRSWGYLQEAAA